MLSIYLSINLHPMSFLPPLLFLLLLLLVSFPFSTISPRPIPNNTWPSFHHLLDLQRGSKADALPALKQYFIRFGYLSPNSDPAAVPSSSFDARFETAVLLYQANLGLPATAKLDAATLARIMTPRCGVPDSNATGPAHSKRFTFFSGKPRWAGSKPLTLTYAISPEHTINYVSRADVAEAIRRSFAHWSRVIPVRIKEAAEYETADVKVGFYGGDHGDGEPFDGVLGILGHAFSPESGRLHLDSAERWAVDLNREASEVAVDLESVVTHEIGHVLGLGHSAVKEAVMYPSLSPRTKKVELTVDDVEGVQALYGSNPNFQLSQLMESETSLARRIGGRVWIGILMVLMMLRMT